MLNLARLGNANLLARRPDTPFAEIAVPAPGRPTGEGDSLILIRLLLRAQQAAQEYHLAAEEAAKRGAKLIAALHAEASAMESRLAGRAAEVARNLGDPGKKKRGSKAK